VLRYLTSFPSFVLFCLNYIVLHFRPTLILYVSILLFWTVLVYYLILWLFTLYTYCLDYVCWWTLIFLFHINTGLFVFWYLNI
jgi:hypothetical protein